MSRPLTAAALASCLLALVASCVPQSVAWQLAEQRGINRALTQSLGDLKQEVQLIQSRLENEERARWSQQLCKSAKVADFLSELQSGLAENCTAGSNEGALLFMNSQAYAISNLWAKEGIDGLHPSRMGQIRELLDPPQLYPSTRFILLVQPEAESEAGHLRAKEVGESLKRILVSEWSSPLDARARARATNRPRELRVLGPYLLPCRLRGDVSKKYSGPMDRPLLGEPPDGKQRIRVWLFRSNC